MVQIDRECMIDLFLGVGYCRQLLGFSGAWCQGDPCFLAVRLGVTPFAISVVKLFGGSFVVGDASVFTHKFQAQPCRRVVPIIDRIDFSCVSNPMGVLISLTAPIKRQPLKYLTQRAVSIQKMVF